MSDLPEDWVGLSDDRPIKKPRTKKHMTYAQDLPPGLDEAMEAARRVVKAMQINGRWPDPEKDAFMKDVSVVACAYLKAASEIERLRAALEQLAKHWDRSVFSIARAALKENT